MTTRTPARRPALGAPGFKALVTAMSLAITIGGWAVIASNAQAGGQSADASVPPMPTLVPTPAPYVAQTSTTARSQTSSNGGQTNLAVPQLRSVTINPNSLPAPMTITRSSRR